MRKAHALDTLCVGNLAGVDVGQQHTLSIVVLILPHIFWGSPVERINTVEAVE